MQNSNQLKSKMQNNIEETKKFTYGKHNGKTYLEVMNEDPNYCVWALKNLEESTFAKYLKQNKCSRALSLADYFQIIRKFF